MSEFLDIAVWVFEFLVLGLLPLASIILAIYGIWRVGDRLPRTVMRFMNKLIRRAKIGTKGGNGRRSW